MVRVILGLPRDSSFLSSILYEGLLFAARFSPARFDGLALDLPNDFIKSALEKLDESRIENLRVAMSGNDNINTKLFKAYGVDDQSRKTYYDLLLKIKKYSEKTTIEKNEIVLRIELKKGKMFIDGNELAAPQLMKIDRYTGISSLESGLTSQQITIYTSKELITLFLFGLYSSYVASFRQQRQQYHYFLTFSPEEIESMLNNIHDIEYVNRLFRTKEGVVKIFRQTLSKTSINEAILLEVYLNAEIAEMLRKENLEKISTMLFKISPEGQTYKVYETIPITIYGERVVRAVEKVAKNVDRLLENLSEILKPDSVIFDALRNADRYEESSNVIRAIYSLYRFVTLGDANGWFEFVREIESARRKLEGSRNGRGKSRSKQYGAILKSLAYSV